MTTEEHTFRTLLPTKLTSILLPEVDEFRVGSEYEIKEPWDLDTIGIPCLYCVKMGNRIIGYLHKEVCCEDEFDSYYNSDGEEIYDTVAVADILSISVTRHDIFDE